MRGLRCTGGSEKLIEGGGCARVGHVIDAIRQMRRAVSRIVPIVDKKQDQSSILHGYVSVCLRIKIGSCTKYNRTDKMQNTGVISSK